MGKWAMYRRRGGGPAFGVLGPPGDDQWSVGPGGSGQLLWDRLVPLPTPSTHILTRGRLAGTATWYLSSTHAEPSWYSSGHTPGAYMELQIAWWQTDHRISDFSSSKFTYAGPAP